LEQKLIPNESLIYERVNGVVYARYPNRPEIPRWIIGGDTEAVNKANGNLFSYSEWNEMMELAKNNPTLKTQIKKLLDIYYIIKDDKNLD